MSEYSELKKIIQTNNSFVLTTHVNPDGDAIGSVMAVYHLLKNLNKEVRVINYSPTPYFLQFLDPEGVIEQYNSEIHPGVIISADVFMAIDFNTPSRLSRMSEDFNKRTGTRVCIDHHQNPQPVFDFLLVDTLAAATGHILYNFIENTKIVEIDYDIAVNLYAAIMTDTGSFRFERTTPEVHHIAARLIEKGVSPVNVYAQIYDQNSPGKLTLLGEILSSVKLFGENGEVGTVVVSADALKRHGIEEADTDGFVNFIMSIASVKIGLKFIEVTKGCKVSLRSKGDLQVNLLAAKYGGGGHKNASGIRLPSKHYYEVYDQLIEEAINMIKENEAK